MNVKVCNASGCKILAMWSGEVWSYGHFLLANGSFELKDVPLDELVKFIFLPGSESIEHRFVLPDETFVIPKKDQVKRKIKVFIINTTGERVDVSWLELSGAGIEQSVTQAINRGSYDFEVCPGKRVWARWGIGYACDHTFKKEGARWYLRKLGRKKK